VGIECIRSISSIVRISRCRPLAAVGLLFRASVVSVDNTKKKLVVVVVVVVGKQSSSCFDKLQAYSTAMGPNYPTCRSDVISSSSFTWKCVTRRIIDNETLTTLGELDVIRAFTSITN